MRKPELGISCPGCPHRAAYVVVKDAVGRGRGRVFCGDAGCRAVGAMHPAATTCPGGEEALLPRYRQAIPDGTTPVAKVCAHFIPAEELLAPSAPDAFTQLALEGETVLLCALASSARFLDGKAIEHLESCARNLDVRSTTVLDPFDTLASTEFIRSLLERGGAHALIFATPCAQLLQTHSPEPVEIDRLGCQGCHRCKQLTGCPALVFAPPAYTVDAEACAGCDLCTDYCRTRVIMTPRARMTPAERRELRMRIAQNSR